MNSGDILVREERYINWYLGEENIVLENRCGGSEGGRKKDRYGKKKKLHFRLYGPQFYGFCWVES